MSEPVVSVCIANYNGAACLRECIDSVFAQVGAPPYEILVHDDSSSDGSHAIASGLPGVRLLQGESNAGYCISNNRMAAVARGNYLLLLNNDAVLFPDALRTLYEATHDPHDPVLSLAQYDYTSGELLDRGMRIDPFANPIPATAVDSEKLATVMGSCLWISRAAWESIGGFPEWFGSIGEDLYLCTLARLAGHPIRVCAQSGYRHRVGTSFGGGKIVANRLRTTMRRRYFSERNKTFVLIIATPTLLLVPLLTIHLGLLLIEGLSYSCARWNIAILTRVYLPALVAPLHMLRPLCAARSAAQARRRISWRRFAGAVRWTHWKLVLLVRHGFPAIH